MNDGRRLGPKQLAWAVAAAVAGTAALAATLVTAPGNPPGASLSVASTSAASTSAASTARAEAAPAGKEPSLPEDLRTRTDGSDWPTFLGPTRDGVSSETGIRSDWQGGLPIAWQLELGEGYGAPSIERGRIFVFDRVDRAGAPGQARLRCARSETGEPLWQETYPTDYEDMYGYSNGPRTSPVVDGARVFVYGVEGLLRAHAVDSGELLWQVDTVERYGVRQNFFGVGSTPVVEGRLLIAQVGGSPPEARGVRSGSVVGNGTGIVAFDKATGEELYRLSDELASYAAPVLATIGETRWGFAFARGGLVGFDPVEGVERFHFPWRAKLLESVNAATPVVVDDRVFLTETYGPGSVLLEIPAVPDGSAVRPEVVWKDGRRNQSMASHWATPVHAHGTLYGSSGRSSGNAELRAIRLATGEVLWSHPGMRRSSLLLVDGHLVVLGEYGELWLVKATPDRFELVSEWTPKSADGDPLLAFPAWNAPALAQGLLYVRGKNRLLVAELVPPAPRAPSN